MAADDPLRDQLLAVARDQIERLPYSLDRGARELLETKIERGAEIMRSEGRADQADVDLAERHLRDLLEEVESRTVIVSSGEAVVLADGLESVLPANKWWPFV